MPKIKWTVETLKAEASRYKTRKDFFDGNSSAYCISKKLNVFEEVCAHMPKDVKLGKKPHNFKWAEKDVLIEAKKYENRSQFQLWARGAYASAKRLNILNEACAHMTGDRRESGSSGDNDNKHYHPVNAVNDLKYKALRRGIVWELDPQYAFLLITSKCHYCGHGADWPKSRIGIDRIDSNRGYIMGNVRSCCHRCNTAKNNMSEDEFIIWLEQTFRYFILGER